jgi:hypothetical protein
MARSQIRDMKNCEYCEYCFESNVNLNTDGLKWICDCETLCYSCNYECLQKLTCTVCTEPLCRHCLKYCVNVDCHNVVCKSCSKR